ncbi:putative disease resistance protein RGA3 [Silene latifolia]|uniref:putative disease resistance protein RGA3 n=1 Tax=Silene latifolia TaxID=37657 RepID=UPI003D77E051
MAKAIVFSIAQSLLKNLSLRALDEIASAWGFKNRLEQLKNTINTINDMLVDAEERQVESHTIRGWLDRLKTVVYDADDLFDEFATMASQREVMGGHNIRKEVLSFFSDSNCITFAFSISRRIKKVREELDQIAKDSLEFAFVQSVLRPQEGVRSGRDLSDSHSFVHAEEIVGRDDDKEAIIDILMASSAAQDRKLSVIPILGIGGQGKTTLAQLVYNDDRIKKHFELKLWVCVSEVFDIKQVIKKILMSATNNETQNLEIDQLQGRLRKEIGEKKYLLVLDNVWNEEPQEWTKLSAILKVGGHGSKILVTTRSRKVANIMGSVTAYDLNGLSEEKSWALFEKMAFEEGESQEKPDLVKLGEEIVKKCAGVPLALRSLGTLLRGKDEQKWSSIAGTSFAELPDEQNGIMAILKFSYHHLLSPLKNCFSYCALFPKDYKFDKDTLVDLWIAEGFVVSATETQSLKELGDDYLMILLQRCFFQDIRRDKWGNILSFKMHELMHDLAVEVAGTESKVAKLLEINFSDQIRRLSLGYHLTNSWKIPDCMLKANRLRTFLLPVQFRDGSDFNQTVLKLIISNFRCLRVLDLRNLGVRILPKSIVNLIHLRYLNLSMNPLEELPHSVTRLHNLQTLILYHCRRLTALPIHTRKLTNLMTLNVLGCRLLNMPSGLGELTSLHKLPCFIVNRSFPLKLKDNTDTAQLKDLKNLNNLRGALKIKLVEDLEDPAFEAVEANLNSKKWLTELSVKLGGVRYGGSMPSSHDEAILEGLKPHKNLKKLDLSWYRGQKLPSWAIADSLCRTLPNLVEIRLLHCGSCQQVPSFSQLPFLRCLRLVGLRRVEYIERSLLGIESPPLPSTESFFPSLQELELRAMANLKGWWEETELIECNGKGKLTCYSSQRTSSFPLLEKLRIENCKNLASFPLSPNVKNLVLSNVKKELTVLKKLSGCSAESNHVGSSVSVSEYSSKLTTLSVDEVEDLISLPEECLGHITSLEIQNRELLNTGILEEVFKRTSILRCLKLTDCRSLTSISVGLEHLTLLESLVIHNCGELDLSQDPQLVDGMPWKALNSLRLLEFHSIPKLLHLPSGLQHLTRLRSLKLSFNENLETLPKWIGCFSSLAYMRLFGCPLLTCLPDEFCKLTSLNELEIVDCRELTTRCRGSTGSDWPKIEHIPLLTVKDSYFD